MLLMKGTLSLSIPNSTTSLNDLELQTQFGTCGDIKSILPNPKNPSDRLIDYFDCRVSFIYIYIYLRFVFLVVVVSKKLLIIFFLVCRELRKLLMN